MVKKSSEVVTDNHYRQNTDIGSFHIVLSQSKSCNNVKKNWDSRTGVYKTKLTPNEGGTWQGGVV